jgi:hypothetical protein
VCRIEPWVGRRQHSRADAPRGMEAARALARLAPGQGAARALWAPAPRARAAVPQPRSPGPGPRKASGQVGRSPWALIMDIMVEVSLSRKDWNRRRRPPATPRLGASSAAPSGRAAPAAAGGRGDGVAASCAVRGRAWGWGGRRARGAWSAPAQAQRAWARAEVCAMPPRPRVRPAPPPRCPGPAARCAAQDRPTATLNPPWMAAAAMQSARRAKRAKRAMAMKRSRRRGRGPGDAMNEVRKELSLRCGAPHALRAPRRRTGHPRS